MTHFENSAETSQETELMMRGIELDYAHLDEIALTKLQEETPMASYMQDLNNKIAEARNLRDEMKGQIMESSGDLGSRVDLQKNRDRAENILHHAFTQPITPDAFKREQTHLENAPNDYQRHVIGRVERMAYALRGEEIDLPEGKKPMPSEGELKRLKDAETLRNTATAEQLNGLIRKVDDALDRLKKQSGEVIELAREKKLPEDKKEEAFRSYEERYAEFEEIKKDLEHMLQNL